MSWTVANPTKKSPAKLETVPDDVPGGTTGSRYPVTPDRETLYRTPVGQDPINVLQPSLIFSQKKMPGLPLWSL